MKPNNLILSDLSSYLRGGWQRGQTWSKENAVDINFGALRLPDGQGRAAAHTVDGKTVFVEVAVPTTHSSGRRQMGDVARHRRHC